MLRFPSSKENVIAMLGYGAGYTPLFLCAKLEKSIDIIPKRVCNIKHREEEKRKISAKHWKGDRAMGKKKKHKKKPIKWQSLAANALIDLIVGTALIIIDKLLG